MKDIFKRIFRFEWAFAGGIACIFVVDILLPRGVVEWVFYSIPLFLTLRSSRKNLPFVVAAVCSALIVAGFFLSRPGLPAVFSIVDRSMGIVLLIASAILIERHRHLEGALQRSYETMRALLRRLEQTREEERTRLARDVHDNLGQSLTALKMDLRWIERKLGTMGLSPELDAVKARTAAAIDVVDDTTVSVQELAAQLRPSLLDRLGLGPAILSEVRRFQARGEIVCKTSITPSLPVLVPGVATALFRIFQECLTNVARHAGASRVAVRLGMRGTDVILRVLDNGSGISAAALGNRESLGLLGMKERTAALGGEVLFRRGRKRGTLVTVRIPNREP